MKIAFVGDIMLGRLVNEVFRERPMVSVWGDTLPIFRGADCRIGNLECVITDKDEKWVGTPKQFFFRSDSKNIAVLTEGGINAVSLANNHTLDYGEEGMRDGLAILTRAGVNHAGAGPDLTGARMPRIWKVGGNAVGMVSFTDNMPEWEANEKKAGVYYVPTDLSDNRAKGLIQLIKETKKTVDFLIVAAHWGGNWGYKPPREHTDLGRALIEAGADVIFGHSAHVFRGVEVYRGKLIIYSAGNFIDDYAVDEIERNDQSFIFVVETNEKGIERVYLYPTLIADFTVRMAKGAERDAIWKKMASLCADLGTVTKWNEMRGRLEVAVGA